MWSGAALKIDRKADDPIFADPALVGVTGGIQPDILPEIGRRGGASVHGDDGMVHRFLFCYPERSVVLADLTGYDVEPVTSFHYAFLYDQLRNLEHSEDGEPVTVRFTPEGEAAWDRHNRAIRAEMYRPGFPRTLQGTWPKLASSQLARLSLLFALSRAAWNDEEPEAVTEGDVEDAARVVDYFKAHARRVHFSLYPETKDERLLRAVGDLLAERDDYWKADLPDFREVLEAKLSELGAVELPERDAELTKKLLRQGETEEALSVEQGWFHEGRALVLRATPGARVPPDGVGTVGTDDTPVPTGNGERMVAFVLRTRGPMFSAEIAEATGLAHRTVKNVLSRLRQVPYPRVEDTGETDEHSSNQVRLVERSYGDGTLP